ncbi:hypothetical protein ACFL1X_08585 [Candidatus Hydrogenedentota bacterium]
MLVTEKDDGMKILSFASTEEFDQLLGLIHDENFELDQVRYDANQELVEIPYRRIFHEGPSRTIKNRWIYRVVEIDVLRNILRVRNVKNLEIVDKARIGCYSFNYLKYGETTGELVFECCEPCQLRLMVSDIDMENEELGYRGKARIVQGLFWDANTNKVYD